MTFGNGLEAKSQGGIHLNGIPYYITLVQLSHKSLALTENAYGCYISGVAWSTIK